MKDFWGFKSDHIDFALSKSIWSLLMRLEER